MADKMDDSKRMEAAKLFSQGHGYKAVSTELGVNRETVRDWAYTWRALGDDGLLKDHRTSYSPETKLAAVCARRNGETVVEVMEKYHIYNRSRLKEWCRAYKKYGESAFL